MKEAQEILDEILEAATHSNDIAKFGKEVADILKENEVLAEPAYEVLTGK